MPTCVLKSPKRTKDCDEVAFPNAASMSSRKASYSDFILVRTPARHAKIAAAALTVEDKSFLLSPNGTQITTHSAMLRSQASQRQHEQQLLH